SGQQDDLPCDTPLQPSTFHRTVKRFNHRPHKVLGFRLLPEVLFEVEMHYTKPSSTVALRI
ncbi:MAG: hypothetical protein WBO98_08920, partial [Candidatus Nitrotoga sp.]